MITDLASQCAQDLKATSRVARCARHRTCKIPTECAAVQSPLINGRVRRQTTPFKLWRRLEDGVPERYDSHGWRFDDGGRSVCVNADEHLKPVVASPAVVVNMQHLSAHFVAYIEFLHRNHAYHFEHN